MGKLPKLAIATLLICALVLLGQNLILAQGPYPKSADKYVNDFAKILKPRERNKLRTLLQDLDSQKKLEATVVTISSIKDYEGGTEGFENFTTYLFNSWGIGHKEKNDGILILVAVNDHKVRIELGSGYGAALDPKMQQIIDREMLPAFRHKDYSTGIYKGTVAVINEVTKGTYQLPATREHSWVEIGLVVGLVLIGLFGTLGLIVFDSFRYISKLRQSWLWKQRADKRKRRDDWNYPHSGSSSSRGGSFGGGSSGGGGASGSW